MKKIIAILLLAALALTCLVGCQSGESSAELKLMQQQLQLMQQQLDEAKEAGFDPSGSAQATPAATDAPEPAAPADESGALVSALHSSVNGETSLRADSGTELTAVADVPDGMAVDHWEVNGVEYYVDEKDTFTFSVNGDTVVDARLRPECKVTCINAQMQFLNSKNKPKGDAYTEFVFEEDYENPVTKETQSGGWITAYVSAVVPKGYEVDYWLINFVPYYFNRTVTAFTVYDLNEATVYEVVLKAENAPSSTPRPTLAPTAAPTSAPAEEPKVYYSVSCDWCTFSGGGYSGAASGSVPAGTVITVTPNGTASGFWRGSYSSGDMTSTVPASSISFTVDGDCSFSWTAIIS